MPDYSPDNSAPDAPLKNESRLLNSILNTVPFELVVRDADSRILFANLAFAATYNSVPEKLIGQRDAEYWAEFGRSAEEISAWLAEDRQILRSGESIEYVQEIVRQSGEIVYYHNIKKPLRLADGRSCVLAIYTEITEQRRTEDELRRAQANSAELDGIHKAAVTYAHEINNPLTGILANVQIMLESQEMGSSEFAPEAVEMLEDINTSAQRIRDVIRKMEALQDAKTKPYLSRSELIDLNNDK